MDIQERAVYNLGVTFRTVKATVRISLVVQIIICYGESCEAHALAAFAIKVEKLYKLLNAPLIRSFCHQGGEK